MFGFGLKKNIPAGVAETSIPVRTMPKIFYGGQDPEIYAQTKTGQKSNSISATVDKPSGGLVSRRTLLIAFSVLFFLLAVAGISWYYLKDYKRAASSNDFSTPSVTETKLETTPSDSELATTSLSTEIVNTTSTATSTDVSTPPSLLLESPFVFPTKINLETPDLDNDGLTDNEEEVIGTDSGVWDTDADGYYDGQELFNLYNPKGKAPVLLIDSGIVTEYVNPVWGYRVYYPFGWQVGAVDSESRQVLFSAAGGDYIEIRVSQLLPGEDFVSWFGRKAVGERITDLTEAVNRFNVTVRRRSDDLVGYIINGRTVYVFIYTPREVGPIAYKHFMNMLTQSFRSGSGASEIETQPVLPVVATSSAIAPFTEISTTTNTATTAETQ